MPGPSELEVSTVQPPKPILRGRLHQVAFFVAIPAGIVLISLAHRTAARVAAVIYAVSLLDQLGTSAAYHVRPWSARALRRMKRLDHSMIFVLIAGTYTPMCLLVLHGAWSIAVLVAAWAGAVAGIALKMARVDGLRRVTGTLYISLGWLVVVALPQTIRGLSPVALGLLVTGGIMYTGGAVVLARRRPDPSPRVFGYHEVWHSFTVAASACHFAVIMLVTLAAH